MAKSKTPATHLRVRIYSVPKYSTKSVRVFFEITNKGKKPVSVLRRHTPLEGLLDDSLTVKRNGKAVKYDGLHVKRLSVSPDEFIELKPDQSQSREVDLSEAYPLLAGGNVSVSFKKKFLRIMGGKLTNAPAKITAVPANFNITSALRPTIGMRHREAATNGAPLTSAARTLVGNIIIEGATPEQEALLAGLHDQCMDTCRTAGGSVRPDAKYNEWFGEYTQGRANKVLSVYERIPDRASEIKFTYICNDPNKCGGTTVAQTTFESTTILICAPFWGLPRTGEDSQVSTLVHEHSHASVGTKDEEGGKPDLARQLARNDANRATNCAYNIEYFACL